MGDKKIILRKIVEFFHNFRTKRTQKKKKIVRYDY